MEFDERNHILNISISILFYILRVTFFIENKFL